MYRLFNCSYWSRREITVNTHFLVCKVVECASEQIQSFFHILTWSSTFIRFSLIEESDKYPYMRNVREHSHLFKLKVTHIIKCLATKQNHNQNQHSLLCSTSIVLKTFQFSFFNQDVITYKTHYRNMHLEMSKSFYKSFEISK